MAPYKFLLQNSTSSRYFVQFLHIQNTETEHSTEW